MARPILKVKNIAEAPKRYGRVAKKGGRKAVRTEFGIPFPLQSIIAAKPAAKSAILGVLSDGDRLDGQKLVRLLGKADSLTGPQVVEGVQAAIA